MLEWSEYLKTVVSSKTVIDNFTLSCDEGAMRISPIVKASILMLEDMISSQGNHNIFVFPEIQHLSKEFLLSKVIYHHSRENSDVLRPSEVSERPDIKV